MKKYIEIINARELFDGMKKGTRFDGVLYRDKVTGKPTFKAWNRTAPKHRKEKKIRDLDNGWLGMTEVHITRHERFARSMGLANIRKAMDCDNRQSKEVLVDMEIIDNA